MTLTPQRTAVAPRDEGRSRAILVWSVLGLLALVTQLIVYGRWIASPAFHATAVGPDPIPATPRIAMRVYEVISLVSLVFVIPWFLAGWRRAGRLDTVRLFMLGWLSAYWLDPWLNFLRPMFTYNAYAVNRGCWCSFMPFWSSTQTAIAEPLLIDGPSYFMSFAGTALIAVWAMQQARKRLPGIGTFGLGLAGFVGVWLSMGLLDVVATYWLRFDAWPIAFQAASFWGGTSYQFPIYEFILFPSTFVACAFLIFHARADGTTAIERGLGRLRVGKGASELLRVLAFIGFCNMLNLVYTTAMGVHATVADPWPADMPSWLANR